MSLGTQIIPLLYNTTIDEKLWEKPLDFNPDRHIANGVKLDLEHNMLTFGTGQKGVW